MKFYENDIPNDVIMSGWLAKIIFFNPDEICGK